MAESRVFTSSSELLLEGSATNEKPQLLHFDVLFEVAKWIPDKPTMKAFSNTCTALYYYRRLRLRIWDEIYLRFIDTKDATRRSRRLRKLIMDYNSTPTRFPHALWSFVSTLRLEVTFEESAFWKMKISLLALFRILKKLSNLDTVDMIYGNLNCYDYFFDGPVHSRIMKEWTMVQSWWNEHRVLLVRKEYLTNPSSGGVMKTLRDIILPIPSWEELGDDNPPPDVPHPDYVSVELFTHTKDRDFEQSVNRTIRKHLHDIDEDGQAFEYDGKLCLCDSVHSPADNVADVRVQISWISNH